MRGVASWAGQRGTVRDSRVWTGDEVLSLFVHTCSSSSHYTHIRL